MQFGELLCPCWKSEKLQRKLLPVIWICFRGLEKNEINFPGLSLFLYLWWFLSFSFLTAYILVISCQQSASLKWHPLCLVRYALLEIAGYLMEGLYVLWIRLQSTVIGVRWKQDGQKEADKKLASHSGESFTYRRKENYTEELKQVENGGILLLPSRLRLLDFLWYKNPSVH